MAIFMNSAQGGMVTADNRNLDQPKDPHAGTGTMLARGKNACGSAISWRARPCASSKTRPSKRTPSSSATRSTCGFRSNRRRMWAVVTGSPLKYPHNDDHSINARINLVNLGDAQILTIPGEALPNIGFYLKRKMHGKHNLLFGLTNEAFGYILTKVDFHSFPRYDYVSRTSLGEMTGEILIEKSLELVNKSPSPDH